ncbi:MAG: KTSC domain-containing protein [Polyangiaceae bacterium]
MLHVSQMERIPVESSSIASVGYDKLTSELEIEFRNGRVYRYELVPPAAYRLLLQAPSIGEYVNRVIKPRFEARSV